MVECGTSTAEFRFNQALGRYATQLAQAAGAQATYLDVGALNIPLYDGDLEVSVGLPDGVKTLRAALFAHDALIIASPEYNGFPSPLLKNVLDWASRKQPDEPPRTAFVDKIALLASATRGESLGARGLGTLRQLLNNLKVTSLAETFSLPKGGEAFSAEGRLLDAAKVQELEARIGDLIAAVREARLVAAQQAAAPVSA